MIERYEELVRENKRLKAQLREATQGCGNRAAARPHPDDVAVDRFAAAMKAKLNKKRQEGRGGVAVHDIRASFYPAT